MTAPQAIAPRSSVERLSALGEWSQLAPLPDPIGYAGMFAGVLSGHLLAGGGSQFPETPLWMGGKKDFSDRIFRLTDPLGKWSELNIKLPYPVASPAVASGYERIYLAGGMDDTQCLSDVLEISQEGEVIHFRHLSPLPERLAYAAAAVAQDRLYVVGGISSLAPSEASCHLWSLSLDLNDETTWRRETDVPGFGVFVPALASDATGLYLIGGATMSTEGKMIPLNAAYRFEFSDQCWKRLPDLPEPRVAPASPAPIVDDTMLFVIGGYAEAFSGPPREHPGFSTQTYYFDLASQSWSNGATLPQSQVENRDITGELGPSAMAGAPAAVWQDRIVVVSGETRASVRTPAVMASRIKTDQPR